MDFKAIAQKFFQILMANKGIDGFKWYDYEQDFETKLREAYDDGYLTGFKDGEIYGRKPF